MIYKAIVFLPLIGFLVAGLLRLYGQPIRLFIEKYLGTLTVVFCVLLIGGFYLVKFIV